MNRIRVLFKIFLRMFAYGIVLGGIAGALVLLAMTIPTTLTQGAPSDITIGNMPYFIAGAVIWGGIFGGLFGGNAGFFSGIIIAGVTAVGFREIRKPQMYKITMGFITLITSSLCLFAGWQLIFGTYTATTMEWASAMVMSVIIAVYVSQITVQKYINEVSVRKAKAKV